MLFIKIWSLDSESDTVREIDTLLGVKLGDKIMQEGCFWQWNLLIIRGFYNIQK